MIELTKQELAQTFRLGYHNNYLDDENYYDILKNFLFAKIKISKEEVKKQLIERVCDKLSEATTPVAVLHSSGIDSTFMLLMLRKCFEEKEIKPVRIGYMDSPLDESKLSDIICKELKIHGTVKNFLSEKDLDCFFDNINEKTYKDLFFNSSLIPTFYAMRSASQFSSIVTGDGGDESFCGYDRYVFCNRMDKLSTGIKRLIYGFSHESKNRRTNKIREYLKGDYRDIVGIWTHKEIKSLFGENQGSLFDDRFNEIDLYFKSQKDSIEKYMMFDIGTELLGLEAQKVNTAARMAKAPLVISPFMDIDMIKWCASLPLKYKYRFGERKVLLKEIIRDEFPEYFDIVKGKKKGFAVPIGEWFKSGSVRYELEYYVQWVPMKLNLFDFYMWKTHDDFLQIGTDNSEKLWSIFLLSKLIERNIFKLKESVL